ncbi:hypothetical protein C1Y40_05165 [Mycobacterium talmoniae]|uniref:Uncharacterized protein n=1 Tax=Mycobacterium talmoniae TaxID=1858794 RepID=A0A2S8BDE8_9MYCO|nr:hypothetical protein C1Y40_05165 [Mycobacterium talmoniae]
MRPVTWPRNQPAVIARRSASPIGSEACSGRVRRSRQNAVRPGPAVDVHCWAAGLSTESNANGE